MWILFLIIGIFLVVVYLAYIGGKSPEEIKRDTIEKEKQHIFSVEYPRLQQIINESLEIINRTKNIDTAIGRFDLIKEKMKRLLEIAPHSAKLSTNYTIFIHPLYTVSSPLT